MIQLFNEKFNLFKYSVVVITVCFLVLSLGHFDYFIAKYDMSRYTKNNIETDSPDDFYKHVDYNYLMLLSTDAAPAMMEHKEEIYAYMEENGWDIDEVMWSYQYYSEGGTQYKKMTLRKFNLSRYIARLSVEKYIK